MHETHTTVPDPKLPRARLWNFDVSDRGVQNCVHSSTMRGVLPRVTLLRYLLGLPFVHVQWKHRASKNELRIRLGKAKDVMWADKRKLPLDRSTSEQLWRCIFYLLLHRISCFAFPHMQACNIRDDSFFEHFVINPRWLSISTSCVFVDTYKTWDVYPIIDDLGRISSMACAVQVASCGVCYTVHMTILFLSLEPPSTGTQYSWRGWVKWSSGQIGRRSWCQK